MQDSIALIAADETFRKQHLHGDIFEICGGYLVNRVDIEVPVKPLAERQYTRCRVWLSGVLYEPPLAVPLSVHKGVIPRFPAGAIKISCADAQHI